MNSTEDVLVNEDGRIWILCSRRDRGCEDAEEGTPVAQMHVSLAIVRGAGERPTH